MSSIYMRAGFKTSNDGYDGIGLPKDVLLCLCAASDDDIEKEECPIEHFEKKLKLQDTLTIK